MQQDRSPHPARQAPPRGLAPGETRTAICPVCDYAKPSLSVTNKGGRLLVYCFNRCCEQPRLFRAAMDALRAGDLDWASLSAAQKRADWDDYGARLAVFVPLEDRWRNQAVDVADHAIARRYLESRRCVIPPRGSGLRAIDSAYHHPTKTHWPALVGLIIADQYSGGDVAVRRGSSFHTTPRMAAARRPSSPTACSPRASPRAASSS